MKPRQRPLWLAGALFAACWHEHVELGAGRAGRRDAQAPEPRDEEDGDEDGERSFSDECGGDAYPARGEPLELLVLLDKSFSMALPAIDLVCVVSALSDCSQNASGTIPTYWDVASRELRTFISDPRSTGVRVALTYFGDNCSADSYATPTVTMGTLPEHALELQRGFELPSAFFNTATRPALEGSITYLREQARKPGYKAHPMVFLVTDGFSDEEDCTDNTTRSVSQVAAAGFQNTPSVKTYVFITAAGLALDEIAEAGGTTRSLTGDLLRVGALSTTLNRVRDVELASLPCAYDLPSAYASDVTEPSRVNLTVAGKPLNYVGTSARCSATRGGWYYDDPTKPHQILACPSSCEQIKGVGSAEIVLKCDTVVPS